MVMIREPHVVSTTVSNQPEANWSQLYSVLQSLARHLVYSFNVSTWRGQEHDLIEDIVQETIRRLFERMRKAERGEVEPVRSLEQMVTTVAYNYCKDLRRRDRRLVHALSGGEGTEAHESLLQMEAPENFVEQATEDAYREGIFVIVAREVMQFPLKQREAMLADLAEVMYFGASPTPLQAAFLELGVDLRQHRPSASETPYERGKRIALRNHAYRRLGSVASLQPYISEARRLA